MTILMDRDTEHDSQSSLLRYSISPASRSPFAWETLGHPAKLTFIYAQDFLCPVSGVYRHAKKKRGGPL
jgi:hypothetical protein